MNATTTHDTKRSEDARARINVLSEISARWKQQLEKWSKLNAKHKSQVNGQQVPDRNEEIFLYQTLLGIWPPDGRADAALTDRLQAYAIKATREAMVHTRWTLPNAAHENALKKFVAALLKPSKDNTFLRDFAAFQKSIACGGMINGLAQTLLKIISPGIPDFYQGSELWDLRLVDPDNRQPVDFKQRASMLAALKQHPKPSSSLADELTRHWEDGRIKLYAIWKALNFRRERSSLFTEGDFVELKAIGPCAEHVLAFVRHHNREWTLFIAPRWLARAQETTRGDIHSIFRDTTIRLPQGAPQLWENIFTGENIPSSGTDRKSIAVGDALLHFPIALLSNASVSRDKH
jgi:(1->4)-alpha-D-glucan 1-alpha-D-glucosylmutase